MATVVTKRMATLRGWGHEGRVDVATGKRFEVFGMGGERSFIVPHNGRWYSLSLLDCKAASVPTAAAQIDNHCLQGGNDADGRREARSATGDVVRQ